MLGDENSQVAVCVTGYESSPFDPRTHQPRPHHQQQLSAPIQVSDPFPSQGGDMYFPPPDLAAFIGPGGGTPRSRLPINTQQSYPPDDQRPPPTQPAPARWNTHNYNNGVAPAPPPRIGHPPHAGHHQHSLSDGDVVSSPPPPPPPPRTSPPKLSTKNSASQEDIFQPVKNNHKNVVQRHSGGFAPAASPAVVDAASQSSTSHEGGEGGANATFSTFKPRLPPGSAHPSSTASSSGVSSWGSASSFLGALSDTSPSRNKVTFVPMSGAGPGTSFPLPTTPPSSLSAISTPTTPLATQVSTPTAEAGIGFDEKRRLDLHVTHIGEQRAYEKGKRRYKMASKWLFIQLFNVNHLQNYE